VKLLKTFIKEELMFRYWLRRPRSNAVVDVSDEIEDQRRDVFNSTIDDVHTNVERMRHRLNTSTTVQQMKDAVSEFDERLCDIVDDQAELSRAIKLDDVDAVRNQLISSLKKWEIETTKWSMNNNYDTSTLLGHPLRAVASGGSSSKRKIRP
jgi:hypothetical protein